MNNSNVKMATPVQVLAIELNSLGGLQVNSEELGLYLKGKDVMVVVVTLASVTITRYWVGTDAGRRIIGRSANYLPNSETGESGHEIHYAYDELVVGPLVVDFYAPEHQVVKHLGMYYAFEGDTIKGALSKDASGKLVVNVMTLRGEKAFF